MIGVSYQVTLSVFGSGILHLATILSHTTDNILELVMIS